MTLVVLAGLGAGIGALGVVFGFRKPRHSLHAVLTALDREIARPGVANGWGFGPDTSKPLNLTGGFGLPDEHSNLHHPRWWRIDRRVGADLVKLLDTGVRAPVLRGWLESALLVTGTSFEAICSQAALGATVGVLLPFVFWAIIEAGGLHVSMIMPVWVGILCGSAGASLPVVVLSTEVKRRRLAARKVVGMFLDLVVLCLAGGMGIEGALISAAQVGDDDVSCRLLATLSHARDSGDPPWRALTRLGTELGVDELTELAAAAGLAGTQGARIRSTLAAKAVSIRRHELAEVEARANTVTERLFLPGVLLLVGFLLFIGYPAVARIANGL